MVKLTTPARDGPLLAVRRDIETMKTRGAGEIGRAATQALATAAASYGGTSLSELREYVLEAARLLASARPTAVTLRNGLNAMLGELEGARDVDDARHRLEVSAKAYGDRVAAAKREIAKLALPLFEANDVVLTHCHSTAAGGAIAHAAKHRPGIRIFSTETRPFRQGLIQAPALAREGADVTLIVDSAVAHTMATQRVTKVVVGADTVAADGTLYNKIGTRQVALLARSFRIPFIVACERDKFSPYTLQGEPVPIEERPVNEIADPTQLPGVKLNNPVFDATPPDLVQVFVTEKGLVRPTDVRGFMEREFGSMPRWI